MNTFNFLRCLLIITLLNLPCVTIARNKQRIDNDWRFALGKHDEVISPDCNVTEWRLLDLPHDWSVEPEAASVYGNNVGPFTPDAPEGSATGFTVGGEGWYVKDFDFSPSDVNNRYILQFDGVYNEASVWVNGHQTYYNHYGYNPFRFDITDLLVPGATNRITVKAVNTPPNTRWYAGSGIFRHVWLEEIAPVHLDNWNTLITASADGEVVVRSLIINDGLQESDVTFTIEIAGVTKQETLRVEPRGSQEVKMTLNVTSPQLWSPDEPNLYTAVLKANDDKLEKEIGFRSISFNAVNGMMLNGKGILLKGGCVHHDCGLLGAASYDDAEERKVVLMKENGFNAVRTSHNLPSEAFVDACDKYGLLVIDEVFDPWMEAKNSGDYHRFFDEFCEQDVRRMIERDCNHPSIFMWSIGNEVPGRIEPKGIEAAERLRRTILNLDSSRPITAAICDWDYYAHNWEDYDAHAFQSLDAGGYNYLYDKYKKDHTSHPDRIIYGSESYANERSQNWDLVEECPYVIGDFVWTAIDYLGEAGIGSAEYRQSGNQPQFMGYPWFNGWCGDIDLLGEKKPQAYYRDVVWRNEPITMAVEKPVSTGTYQSISKWGWRQEYNSWTFNDCTPNDIMTVNVYSRSPLVRLYLNDQLIDTKATDSMYRTAFSVPYQPGILRSVEYDGTNEGNSFLLETSGFPEAIRLKSDKLHFSDDDQSLIYVTVELVDSQGRIVRDITDKIVFELNGKAQIIASGNGSPMDMESFRSESPSLYEGRAMVVLKGNRKSGKSVLKVKSENYGACSLVINDSEL